MEVMRSGVLCSAKEQHRSSHADRSRRCSCPGSHTTIKRQTGKPHGTRARAPSPASAGCLATCAWRHTWTLQQVETLAVPLTCPAPPPCSQRRGGLHYPAARQPVLRAPQQLQGSALDLQAGHARMRQEGRPNAARLRERPPPCRQCHIGTTRGVFSFCPHFLCVAHR